MICPICLKQFKPKVGQQRYCSRDCYIKARSPKRRRIGKQIALEWLAWNHDFMHGRTVSNL